MTQHSLAHLNKMVHEHATAGAMDWLRDSLAAVRSDQTAIRTKFPATSRSVGHEQFENWSVDDAARILLLGALGEHAPYEIPDLYRFGDANERRAILLSLRYLNLDDVGLSLVRDALRTNDVSLVCAALTPFAIEHLGADELRHAIMKCVFMDIPLATIPGLQQHASPELSKMLAGFVVERVTASRNVQPDVWPLINAYPPELELAAIEAELQSSHDDRRIAAAAALAQRQAALDPEK